MQGRERPAQHFHALAAHQAEVRQLALAIRHGRRDAVGVQAQAAHAEGGARAEAADRELGVLGEVAAVAGQQAGDSAQHFGHVSIGAVGVILQRNHAG